MRDEHVIELMRKAQGNKSQKDFAAELGISAPYLSDIYKGFRRPGRAILKKFGLQKTISYVKAER